MTEAQATEIIALLTDIKELHYWVIASVMFVAGFLPLLVFFVGKGDR